MSRLSERLEEERGITFAEFKEKRPLKIALFNFRTLLMEQADALKIV
jgi:hypothetical protein